MNIPLLKALTSEQWDKLFIFYWALLFTYHEFFLASQHPSAPPGLRRLAKKYAMPARMWHHALNGFLKHIGSQVPGASQHMLIYLEHGYSVLEDLRVNVPSLDTEWAECIKGLDVYRDELRKVDKGQPEFDGTPSVSSGKSPEIVLNRACADRTEHVLSVYSASMQQYEQETNSPCYDLPLYDHSNSQITAPPLPDDVDDHYQLWDVSIRGDCSGVCLPNARYGELDWHDSFQSASEPAASTSGDGRSSDDHAGSAGEEFSERRPRGIADDCGPGQPWHRPLSEIAILVLAGWLLVGQASSLDFNVFVKVFCILALPDLVRM